MRFAGKVTAVLLVFSFIFVLCACSDKEYYSTDATIGGEKENDMEAILSGTFYFDAIMTSYGQSGKTEFALDGDNIYMRAESDGVDMGMIYMGETMYMLYENKYAALDDTVLKMMEIDPEGDVPKQLGFDKTEILAMFTGLGTPTKEKEELNGVKVTKYTYKREAGGTTVAYLDKNGDMPRAESYSANGSLVETIDFTEVTGVVPTQLFILDNYEKTNLLKLMFEVSQAMPTTAA